MTDKAQRRKDIAMGVLMQVSNSAHNGMMKVLSSKAVKNGADPGREEANLSEYHASSKDEALSSTPNVHEPCGLAFLGRCPMRGKLEACKFKCRGKWSERPFFNRAH